MIERIADRIERELDVVEMVDAAPSVIRRLKAQRVARAALAAIREPTEAMQVAGAVYTDNPMMVAGAERDNDARGGAILTWQAMIDAALTAQDS